MLSPTSPLPGSPGEVAGAAPATGRWRADFPCRVVLVDDHGVVRTGLKLLLAHDDSFRVVGEAATAQQAVDVVERTKPDVVVLDLTLPDASGLQVLGTLRRRMPQAAVVVLTMQEDPAFAMQALQAGAAGFVLKEAAAEELVAALEHVRDGRQHVQATVGARLAAAEQAREQLTDRERRVLSLLAAGNTNEEIAAAMFFSVRTVEAHRARLREKLGLRSRADLAAYARRHGI